MPDTELPFGNESSKSEIKTYRFEQADMSMVLSSKIKALKELLPNESSNITYQESPKFILDRYILPDEEIALVNTGAEQECINTLIFFERQLDQLELKPMTVKHMIVSLTNNIKAFVIGYQSFLPDVMKMSSDLFPDISLDLTIQENVIRVLQAFYKKSPEKCRSFLVQHKSHTLILQSFLELQEKATLEINLHETYHSVSPVLDFFSTLDSNAVSAEGNVLLMAIDRPNEMLLSMQQIYYGLKYIDLIADPAVKAMFHDHLRQLFFNLAQTDDPFSDQVAAIYHFSQCEGMSPLQKEVFRYLFALYPNSDTIPFSLSVPRKERNTSENVANVYLNPVRYLHALDKDFFALEETMVDMYSLLGQFRSSQVTEADVAQLTNEFLSYFAFKMPLSEQFPQQLQTLFTNIEVIHDQDALLLLVKDKQKEDTQADQTIPTGRIVRIDKCKDFTHLILTELGYASGSIVSEISTPLEIFFSEVALKLLSNGGTNRFRNQPLRELFDESSTILSEEKHSFERKINEKRALQNELKQVNLQMESENIGTVFSDATLKIIYAFIQQNVSIPESMSADSLFNMYYGFYLLYRTDILTSEVLALLVETILMPNQPLEIQEAYINLVEEISDHENYDRAYKIGYAILQEFKEK